MTVPRIAVTMGDPAGVGPEIAVKALRAADVRSWCEPVLVGDAARLRAAARLVGDEVTITSVDSPTERALGDAIACVDLANVPDELPWGRLSAQAGQAAYEYVDRAVGYALDGSVAAVCTLPLNKAALHAAGHVYPGHTELLAALTGAGEVSMLLDTGGFKVIHVTTHIGLVEAIERIDAGLVERTIQRGDEAARAFGIDAPRIAVCGINPHAGEGGLFGRGEEEEKIRPAIARVRADGLRVEGPLPADTVFFRAQRGDFDLVVAMYHDQGHGPVKVLGLDRGVNITIGLPIVRTSVDHGTAFDIAGTGTADERSLIAALRAAVALAPARG